MCVVLELIVDVNLLKFVVVDNGMGMSFVV